MSANLYWEPVKRKKHSLGVTAPQSFMDALERAFGNRTPKLRLDHINVLRGMAAATDSEEQRTAYNALADAIEIQDEIEVTAEY